MDGVALKWIVLKKGMDGVRPDESLCMGCVGKGMDEVGSGLVGDDVSYQLDQRLT